MPKLLTLCALGLFLVSCSASGPEELDRLTKEDPQFKQMILARDQMHAEIQLVRTELLNKKRLIDADVEKRRREYDAYAKIQNQKIEKYKAVIEANRNALKREIETGEAQLSAKLTEHSSYDKTLADVKKVISDAKGIRLSTQEKQKWQERVMILSEKIRPLLDEIQDLKLQIRLKKQKSGFLK